MGIDVIVKFISKSTVLIRAYVYNLARTLTDPTGSIKVIIADPDGVQKAGYISVADSSGFTAGDIVTGGTSEATGVIISMPDGTTLELQRVTGVWQSGEALTAEDEETTNTTSALLGATMTKNGDEDGEFDYFYYTDADSPEGSWPGEVWTVDGTGATAKSSVATFNFEVKAGL